MPCSATIREKLTTEIETFMRDDTVLGVVLRDTAGNEIYSWRRNAGGDAAASRAAPPRRCVPTCRPRRAS